VKQLCIICIFFVACLVSCKEEKPKSALPYYGPKEAGPGGDGDTVYHTIPSFSFVNQDGKIVNNNDYNGKIYIADFFFVKCEGICPKMATQLQRVQEKFKNDPGVMILSHTVNPEEDSVEALAGYAAKLKADPKKWNFVTGGKKELYDMARYGYYLTVMEGDGGPDDFIHSETFVLVDPERHIRGIYDGTNASEVDRMIRDIGVLQTEMKNNKEQQQ
jgi:protein SCO1